ncbi:MAG: PilN domain-containing protein [Neptuniibacter sp.]|nr:PilN domain-containing protein [Neptuniibacter sp.]
MPFKYAFLGLIPVVLIGGLLPIYNIANNNGTHTVGLQAKLDDLNHTLQEINRAANSINNVENTISSFRAEAANLREQAQSVSSVNEGFGYTTQLVVDALPAGTSLTSISVGADHISLVGGTSSPSRVIDYAKALENLGEFKSVFITNLSNSFNLEIER